MTVPDKRSIVRGATVSRASLHHHLPRDGGPQVQVPRASGLLDPERVKTHFQSQSSYWRDIYDQGSVWGEIIRERQEVVLKWVDHLRRTSGLSTEDVLELGCGAGQLAVALAQRGLRVRAIDSSDAMVELARQHTQQVEPGVAEKLLVTTGDAYSPPFEDASFDLVVAVGLVPWLQRPRQAIREMARVTRPGGYIIVTSANLVALINFLDPLLNPALPPLKRSIKEALERNGLGSRQPSMRFHMCGYVDRTLVKTGLVKVRGTTLGFGPITLFRRKVLPEPLGVAIHRRLQKLADRGVPGLRSAGTTYLVLARKPGGKPSDSAVMLMPHI
jgi:ubiquinone/menaquinone biosynthesis C-methylase UbiE